MRRLGYRRQFQSLLNWMWQRLEIFTRSPWILSLWSFWCPNLEFRPFFREFPAFVTFNLAYFVTTSYWTPVLTFLNAANWRIKKWVETLWVGDPKYISLCIHNYTFFLIFLVFIIQISAHLWILKSVELKNVKTKVQEVVSKFASLNVTLAWNFQEKSLNSIFVKLLAS